MNGIDVSRLEGAELDRYRQEHVGFVFQAFNLVPSLNARENVAVPLLLAGHARRTAMARADDLLERVGLADRRHRRPAKLSGGQQQRVAIARGLAADPPVLLADEPTANLDYIQAEGIISLLRDLRSDGRAIIVSTHDDRIVPIADRSVHLVQPGSAADDGPSSVSVDPGEVIFEQGARAELVYVIEEGSVRITRRRSSQDDEVLALLGPGEYFGELGPLLGFPRSARATAVGPTKLTAYTIHDFRSRALGEQRSYG